MKQFTNITDDFLALPSIGPFQWGFTTRKGGFSQAPYESLNLGLHVGDNPETVLKNRQAVLDKIAPRGLKWFSANQVHGTTTFLVTAENAQIVPDADILVCREPGFCLAVMVADCVPVILADPLAKIYAVAHCGWRGTVAHGAAKAVREMVKHGATPENIHAAVGPAIGPCCFTTGGDVREQMEKAYPTLTKEYFYPNINLQKLCLEDLKNCGLDDSHLTYSPLCTKCNPDLLFSYRHNSTNGRFIGYIAWPNS